MTAPAKHTPGRLYVGYLSTGAARIVGPANQTIAVMQMGAGRAEATAKRIVDAYNAHDAMLAALRDVRDNVMADSPAMWARVDAAIAKAEGRS